MKPGRSTTETDKLGDQDLYLKYDFRKKLKFIIRCAKRKYYSNQFNKFDGNMKKNWQLINELRGKVQHKNKPSFKTGGQLVHDQRTISNGFNKYLTSIAKDMNQQLDNSSQNVDAFDNETF